MKIERLDVYDFKACLTEKEFVVVKRASDEVGASIEAVVKIVLIEGLEKLKNDLE